MLALAVALRIYYMFEGEDLALTQSRLTKQTGDFRMETE